MMNFQKTFSLIYFALIFSAFSWSAQGADTWYVSVDGSDLLATTGEANDPFLTISNALTHAGTGDTILVAAGTYPVAGAVQMDKNVTVRSLDGWLTTILQGTGQGQRPLQVNHAGAIFDGFTVTGGSMTNGHGGGAYLQAGLITNCLFTGNIVSNAAVALRGGGIYAVGGKVIDCVISNNLLYSIQGTTPHGGGGGLSLATAGRAESCLIVGNLAANTAVGGGASLHDKTTLLLQCTVRGNEAYLGGGIHVYSGRVSDCDIEGNLGTREATAGVRVGGGVYFSGSTPEVPLMDGCRVIGNTAVGYGGGIGLGYGVTISNCVIAGNTAHAGGGVYNYMGSNSSLINCLIVTNQAVRWGGGVFLYRGGVLDGCTVVGNHSDNYKAGGGGIYYEGGAGNDSYLYNTIVYFNTGYAPADWFTEGTTKKLYWEHSCTTPTNGLYGSWNIPDDPAFVSEVAQSGTPDIALYALKRDSPCLDTGVIRSWMSGAVDLLGNPRVDSQSGIPDIGCLERVPPPRSTTLVIR